MININKKVLMKGNIAIAEAALRAGCMCYFSYPITPQTEICSYMAQKMPELGRTFIQAESEIAAANMVYGAASTGVRAMTSSSSPGISLKQECISYLSGAELPAVFVNIMRCGPGLGGIMPAQGDYLQAVKGGGHGDYNIVVLAPNSVQEAYELTVDAFNIADKYRVVSMVLGDGVLGQMIETVSFRENEPFTQVDKSWAVTGNNSKRSSNVVTSVYIDPEILEKHNCKLQAKYKQIAQREVRYEVYNCENPSVIVVGYGIVSRILKDVIAIGKNEGIEIGLIRPISLWPFPNICFDQLCHIPKAFLVVELSAGQMVEDVRLAVNGRKPVRFYGRQGGMLPTQLEILNEIKKLM